jgi:nitrogen-specific signal transduction histidine kinase/CheY-like chemotaxis protein
VSGPVVVREIAALGSALHTAGVESERARVALERAHHAAEQANRGKDEFLAMLGHELRNPLGAIGAAVEVLNRTGGQGDMATSARRVIERQTRHMAQLMNDLQDVARASAGKLTLETRRIELSQLVWRAIEALRLAGRFRQHVLTVDVRPAWLEADPTRLEQVVSNLLTNAVKYTPADGSITLSLRAQEHSVRLTVSDNGMGIAPAMLHHVFDLFVQGERVADRRQAGMGLGLALVRRLVELHDGTVEAASDGPQRGSTFTVVLPGEAASAETSGPWQDRHAVIVAPAEQALIDTAGPLCAAGCRVTLAAEVGTAADVIRHRLPDIVLVDLALPGASALSTELRAAGVDCAIVALSGDEPALEHGFDAVVRRPLDLAALLHYTSRVPVKVFAA